MENKTIAKIELYNQTNRGYFTCGKFKFTKDWWQKNDITIALLTEENWEAINEKLPDYFEQTLRYGRQELLKIKRLYVNDANMLCVSQIHHGMFHAKIYRAFNFYNMIISDGMIYYDKADAMEALAYILENGKEPDDGMWMTMFLGLMGSAQINDLEDVLRVVAKDLTNSAVTLNSIKELVDCAPSREVNL